MILNIPHSNYATMHHGIKFAGGGTYVQYFVT